MELSAVSNESGHMERVLSWALCWALGLPCSCYWVPPSPTPVPLLHSAPSWLHKQWKYNWNWSSPRMALGIWIVQRFKILNLFYDPWYCHLAQQYRSVYFSNKRNHKSIIKPICTVPARKIKGGWDWIWKYGLLMSSFKNQHIHSSNRRVHISNIIHGSGVSERFMNLSF